MKFVLTVALLLFAFAPLGLGQATSSLLSSAAKAEMEEKIRRLQAELEDLKTLNASLSANLNKVTTQVNKQNAALRDFAEAYKISLSDYARRDQLNQLTRSIGDVEKNRAADKKLFLEKFNELRKLILDNPPKILHVPANPRNDSSGRSARPDEPSGIYHTVQAGHTLMDIINAFNAELKRKGRKARVTLGQIKSANPELNPNLIRPGQKIFVPIID